MAKQEIEKKISQSENNNRSDELIELEQELTTINPRIFQGVTPKKKEEILKSISVTMIQERSHSGPLPDADTLIRYNSVIPEGADRIMKMAERQQEHRMSLETKVVNSQSKQSGLGQWFGLIIGLVGIGCGTFLAYSGETTVGGIIAGGTVVSLVSVFVIGKSLQKSQN
ncbi:putative membrane protein [Belliella baltica DSM 15883]|uniref:Putative membrane protein n=1 Tax=Belliella baltica (strain DSM 15883 / CIP 108006 / LMG 21964 / BA134) TaxID=866536 RepID=I3Z785_BELBD|nr:DUF2335 domain-containing protein [Belliella baltica]AFL85103.1 putative membrane protein [Belliella baltica DSM 15883]